MRPWRFSKVWRCWTEFHVRLSSMAISVWERPSSRMVMSLRSSTEVHARLPVDSRVVAALVTLFHSAPGVLSCNPIGSFMPMKTRFAGITCQVN